MASCNALFDGLLPFLAGAGTDKGVAPPDEGSFANGYGVDVSFPIHHYLSDETLNPTRRHFKARYDRLMRGCSEMYSPRECESNEHARVDMNFNQPKTQHNYTELGFRKMKIPDALWRDIQEFWDENKEKQRLEQWPVRFGGGIL